MSFATRFQSTMTSPRPTAVLAYVCGSHVDVHSAETQQERLVAFIQDQSIESNEDCLLQAGWPSPVAKQGSD